MEELNLGNIQEGGEGTKEISEEERKKAQEDAKGARQAAQKSKQSQIKNYNFAVFLSFVLKRYYTSDKIITYVYELIKDIDKNKKDLEIIFSPFFKGETFLSLSDYIDYLKLSKMGKNNIDLVLEIIKFEQIGGEKLWSNLKKSKTISYNEFIKNIKKELE